MMSDRSRTRATAPRSATGSPATRMLTQFPTRCGRGRDDLSLSRSLSLEIFLFLAYMALALFRTSAEFPFSSSQTSGYFFSFLSHHRDEYQGVTHTTKLDGVNGWMDGWLVGEYRSMVVFVSLVLFALGHDISRRSISCLTSSCRLLFVGHPFFLFLAAWRCGIQTSRSCILFWSLRLRCIFSSYEYG